MEFKNEFSWSKSRDDVFNICKRKYYFQHYGSWGGWESTAPERTREIYILKNLSTRQIWIGQVVHDIIHLFLIQLKAGNNLNLSNLLFRLKKRLNEDFTCSESGLYKKFPKRCGLLEHEYKLLIQKEEWDKLFESAEKCIINFYNSDTLKNIKNQDPSQWIFLEDFLSFDFEGTKTYLKIDFAIEKENKIILYDWKTGKERETEMDIQLACYALYISQKRNINPNNIIVKRYNVALDKEDQFEINSQMMEYIKNYMRKSINYMKEFLIDKNNNIVKEEDFPKISILNNCIQCNFKKICEKE